MAYLSIGRTTRGQFEDPEELVRKMQELEENRHSTE